MATAHRKSEMKKQDPIPGAADMKIAIVVSEWNEEITSGLLKGAKKILEDYKVDPRQTFIHHVPGSFELPLAAQFVIEYNKPDAVICLGCVIQGETKHFDYVCEGVSQGIKDVGLKYNLPVIFGVLTDNTIEQSRARSGGKLGNKGEEAALTALKMVALKQKLIG
jgi:6,7-dimethyl-8-ribityllumazine synthase